MGLLSTGASLSWEEIEQYADYIKEHGILQFVALYKSLKSRENDLLKYGDEIEYSIINFDHENKRVRLDLRASEALFLLQENERNEEKNIDSLWRMEYASYMIEGTPGKPFCCSISRLKLIETSMWLRKQQLDKVLSAIDPNLCSLCYSAFPRIGCHGFTYPEIDLCETPNPISRSSFFPDQAIFLDHPRFANLTRNIRTRIGHKQKIYVPVYHDKDTMKPFYEVVPEHADSETRDSVIPDHIYMDCMGFGMGCSCLQVTIQAGNVMEARNLYDQLSVIAPVLMALSAGSPCWKGLLSDWDCRWKIISMACDDRRAEERTGSPENIIRKSRYDTIDLYLHPDHQNFNDVAINYSSEHFDILRRSGVDELLAKHIAHLFCRDPISLFHEKLFIDDNTEIDHFENLQSTNWQSCRFKPPLLNSSVGWRVEFRTLEVQFTCYENSLFVIFVILLSRAIIKSSLSFIIPISLVEQNMDRGIVRDAVHDSSFFFRKNVKTHQKSQLNGFKSGPIIEEMSVDEIFNGKEDKFCGLIPLIQEYVSPLDIDLDTRICINDALQFIGDRASGKILTPATWMRQFISEHPKYQFDSHVSDEILYDLSCEIQSISDGKTACPLLYGYGNVNKVTPVRIEAFKRMIQIESMSNVERRRETARVLNITKSFENCYDNLFFGC